MSSHPSTSEPQYLYLTTIGHRTGNPHEIEIWFVGHQGCYYLVAERRERSHWVQNIQQNSAVSLRVADVTCSGHGRVIRDDDEPELAAAVKALMESKYNWSSGLIVELCPVQ